MHSAEAGMASTFYVDIFGGKQISRMFRCVFHVAKEIGSPALFVIMCTVVNWCFLCSPLRRTSLVSMLRAVAACTLFAGSFLF
jgi:low affinity Fe/Cu permease